MAIKNILIIDDHKEFREMLRSYIAGQIEDAEIKEAESGEEGIEVAIKESPQIALIDIRLPQMDGIQAARQIKQFVPSCHIVTMSMFQENRYQKFVFPEIEAFIEKDNIDGRLILLLRKLTQENGG